MQKLLIAYCGVKQGLNLFTYIPTASAGPLLILLLLLFLILILLVDDASARRSVTGGSEVGVRARDEASEGWKLWQKGPGLLLIAVVLQRPVKGSSRLVEVRTLYCHPRPHTSPFSPSTKLLLKPLPSSRYFEFRQPTTRIMSQTLTDNQPHYC